MGVFVFKLLMLIAMLVYILYYLVGVIMIARETDER
ncbi:hypothetical protein C7M45_00775 [Leuconostoc mesenteroides]|nr:hypothetical protein C7M45_00775 [Leuconostoc mesenteroides]